MLAETDYRIIESLSYNWIFCPLCHMPVSAEEEMVKRIACRVASDNALDTSAIQLYMHMQKFCVVNIIRGSVISV